MLRFSIYFLYAFVGVAKIRAGTEVAIQRLHIMTLSVLFIERAKIGFCRFHIFKVEVGDICSFVNPFFSSFSTICLCASACSCTQLVYPIVILKQCR